MVIPRFWNCNKIRLLFTQIQVQESQQPLFRFGHKKPKYSYSGRNR